MEMSDGVKNKLLSMAVDGIDDADSAINNVAAAIIVKDLHDKEVITDAVYQLLMVSILENTGYSIPEEPEEEPTEEPVDEPTTPDTTPDVTPTE